MRQGSGKHDTYTASQPLLNPIQSGTGLVEASVGTVQDPVRQSVQMMFLTDDPVLDSLRQSRAQDFHLVHRVRHTGVSLTADTGL